MINNILVIEDSKTMNNIIKSELLKLDFNVSQAFTLKDAKSLLLAKEFALIILDLHLPDGEGSELIANIQSLTKTKVIVLTSLQDESLREELFQYGILDYILKDSNLLYSIAEIVKIIHMIQYKSQKKILIIDDSKFVCKQVKTILEPRNYKVSYAHLAKDGIQKLTSTNYDLLILDMELPDMHGLKVLEIIRKNSCFTSLPILVLSGTTTPDIIRNILKNGANAIIKKPFVFEEFILNVDLWIDYFKQRKELKEKNKELDLLNENLVQLVQEEIQKNNEKEKIMFQQSRNAQMGEMIAMIAHQWKQPLNVISTANSVIKNLLRRDKIDTEKVLKTTHSISKNIEYLSTTIDDFRDFFKPNKEKQNTNFDIITQKALSLIEASIKNQKITLNLNIKEISNFNSFENELIQVVLNLLKNAEDVLVAKKVKNPSIEIIIDKNLLQVIDNGGGIKKEIQAKIFDPYFSTKMAKEGTGLGLYMSKIIIEKHCNGSFSVANTKSGACFSIKI